MDLRSQIKSRRGLTRCHETVMVTDYKQRPVSSNEQSFIQFLNHHKMGEAEAAQRCLFQSIGDTAQRLA